ncbi:hypothetical protein V1477_007302 [Vespula maculifrons]|uniref:Dynein light chain n=1 Tax=Vespula maculifrons TaxID=7453 RepID=A0ABD2CJ22_VESMC
MPSIDIHAVVKITHFPFFKTNKMSDRKAVIKNADMSEEMQQDAVDCATQALEKYNIEKDIAAFIKKEFDKKYNPTWHCIVGRNFGSYVTHETRHFIYFYLGQVAILLFKKHEITVPCVKTNCIMNMRFALKIVKHTPNEQSKKYQHYQFDIVNS